MVFSDPVRPSEGRREPSGATLCLPADEAGLARAVECLTAGDLVAVPTETVYGLAADALRPEAVRGIFEAKGRPTDNPLIVHVGRRGSDLSWLIREGLIAPAVGEGPQGEVVRRLINAFWPGPLTLVVPKGSAVPDTVSAGQPTVAVRMPAHARFLDLLDVLPFPLAAPSANRSNRISPTAAPHVMAELGGRIALVLDGGPCAVGVESTIVSVSNLGQVQLLRPGGLALQTIEAVTGAVIAPATKADGKAVAPGMRRVHYAPSTRMLLVPPSGELRAGVGRLEAAKQIGVLVMGGLNTRLPAWAEALRSGGATVRGLGDEGGGESASKALFAELRALDALGLTEILVEEPQHRHGLWPAITDRLTRAAAAFETR